MKSETDVGTYPKILKMRNELKPFGLVRFYILPSVT